MRGLLYSIRMVFSDFCFLSSVSLNYIPWETYAVYTFKLSSRNKIYYTNSESTFWLPLEGMTTTTNKWCSNELDIKFKDKSTLNIIQQSIWYIRRGHCFSLITTLLHTIIKFGIIISSPIVHKTVLNHISFENNAPQNTY